MGLNSGAAFLLFAIPNYFWQLRELDLLKVATMQKSLTIDQFRKNVREIDLDSLLRLKEILTQRLQSNPPEHPDRLFYILTNYSQKAFELGMIEWRLANNPTHYFKLMREAFDEVMEVRPDIFASKRNSGFVEIVSNMMGWNLPFNTEPPVGNEPGFEMLWLDRWVVSGLTDPSCWTLRKSVIGPRNRFITQCLDDYWALLTGQIDPIEGITRCLKNYDRRATHATFRNFATYLGGGQYNYIFVDYCLAAIMKKNNLKSESPHDWIW